MAGSGLNKGWSSPVQLQMELCPSPRLAGQSSIPERSTWQGGRASTVSTCAPQAQISHYADSVAFHLAKILESDKHSVVISSAK